MKERTRQAKINVLRDLLAFELGKHGGLWSVEALAYLERLADIGIRPSLAKETRLAKSNPEYRIGESIGI